MLPSFGIWVGLDLSGFERHALGSRVGDQDAGLARFTV